MRSCRIPRFWRGACPAAIVWSRSADNEYDMKMKMVLASMSGLFEGKVKLTDQQPPDSFRLLVEGKGKIGFMKGDGLLKLEPADETHERELRRRCADRRNHRGCRDSG